jgi:ligand-binding sensor domain-containing protein
LGRKKGSSPFLETNNINLTFDIGLGDTTYLNYDNKSFYQTGTDDWTLVANPDLAEGVDENDVSVFIDIYGRKWLLELYTSDIYYQSPTGWKVIPHEIHGARSGAYFSKFNHPETNDLWLSTYNGLSIYNYESDTWTLVDHSDMDVSYDPITFATRSNGEIYGFAQKEFFKLDQNIAELLITSDSIGNGNNFRFWSIMVDSKDRILLGLNGLVAVYDNGEWSYFTHENSGMVNGNITTIQEDKDGNYWFGSSTGGIAIYNENGLDEQFFTDTHTEIKNAPDVHLIEIYPIPTTGVLNFKSLRIDLTKKVKQIKVFDLSGNYVMGVNSITTNSLDISSLSTGVYVLHIQLDSEVYIVKVIKN